MTEKKRFVQNTNLVMQNNEVYVVCGDEHSADVVTTALNELINENEQLKKLIHIADSLIGWNTIPQVRREWEKQKKVMGND